MELPHVTGIKILNWISENEIDKPQFNYEVIHCMFAAL